MITGRGHVIEHTTGGRGVKKKAITAVTEQPKIIALSYFNDSINYNLLEDVTANNWQKLCGKTPDGQGPIIFLVDSDSMSDYVATLQQQEYYCRAHGLSESERPCSLSRLGREPSFQHRRLTEVGRQVKPLHDPGGGSGRPSRRSSGPTVWPAPSTGPFQAHSSRRTPARSVAAQRARPRTSAQGATYTRSSSGARTATSTP